MAALALGIAVFASIAIAAGTALADDTGGSRSASEIWSSIFAESRPLQSLDVHRMIVVFDASSLGEWQASVGHPLSHGEQTQFIERAKRQQDEQITAMRAAGFDFNVVHHYFRVLNGVSIVLHGGDTSELRSMSGIASVTQVKTVYPADVSASTAASALETAGPVSASLHSPRATVALLDTAVDFNHPVLSRSQATPGYDTLSNTVGVAADEHDSHGTQMAGGIVAAAGDANVGIDSIRVMSSTPVDGGIEAVVGRTDDLIAGFERAVDPNGDGFSDDADGVILVAGWVPYGSFDDAPEARAVTGALGLGSITVAATGNDGASGDRIGTIGSPASSADAIAVGAVDLRTHAPRVDVHARGGVLDTAAADAPMLTRETTLPGDSLPVVVIGGDASDVVDYLGSDVHSRVGGRVALIEQHHDVLISQQVRAAADAGAAAVLIAGADDAAASAVIQNGDASIPAIGLNSEIAQAIRDASNDSIVNVEFTLHGNASNAAYGSVAGFSSGGPTYDGRSKPDLLGGGVGVVTADVGQAQGTAATAVVSGTSIAAATVAGDVAKLRQSHPSWNPASVRSAIVNSAQPVGEEDNRALIELQGAGAVDVDAADAATVIAEPARLDFGSVATGHTAALPLAFRDIATSQLLPLPVLSNESAGVGNLLPSVAQDQLSISVPVDARPGVYGGWLLPRGMSIRVPWTVVVRDARDSVIPVTATLSVDTFASGATSANEPPSELSVALGGDGAGTSLGLRAARNLEITLRDSHGKVLGNVASLTDVLPGVYTYGVSGLTPNGQPLTPGRYVLHVSVRSATAPLAPLTEAATATFTVT